MRFLEQPHLPQSRVRVCALSGRAPNIVDALTKRNISIIAVAPHKFLALPIASHADLMLCDRGNGCVFIAQGCGELQTELEDCGFLVTVSRRALAARYPSDILLNCFELSGVLYCNKMHISPEIIQNAKSRGIKIQQVKQGYAKCSSCIVDQNSMITSDPSIAQAALKNGTDVLTIRPGYINLPGYGYGFIGGASGLIGKNTLAFCGDFHTHPDASKIIHFCISRGVEPISLCGGPLYDIGGILPLLQD